MNDHALYYVVVAGVPIAAGASEVPFSELISHDARGESSGRSRFRFFFTAPPGALDDVVCSGGGPGVADELG
jgi:hypothetical protein